MGIEDRKRDMVRCMNMPKWAGKVVVLAVHMHGRNAVIQGHTRFPNAQSGSKAYL